MGWLKQLLGLEKRHNLANPNVPITGASLDGWYGSRSGAPVNGRTALTYSPVWSAVDIISSDVAKLPFNTYRRTGEREKTPATAHPTFRLLRQYTGEMSSNQWLSLTMVNALVHGNSFSVIHRDTSGRPVWLEWLTYTQVTPQRVNGEVVYQVSRDPHGKRPDLPQYEVLSGEFMFHLPGLLYDGTIGLSLIEYARNTVGRQLSAEGYTDDFFANGAQPFGFLVHPDKLSDAAKENLRKSFEQMHKGYGNSHKMGVLQEGIKWEQIGISPEDALLVDNLNLGVKDVARFFKIPSHKLGDESKTSYNSIEQENRAYLDSTLMSWLSKLEYEANLKLFSPKEVENYRYFTEFDARKLLRADLKTRMDAAAVAITNGILSRNEVREMENLNPYDGGDEFLSPMNMQGESDKEPEPDDEPDNEEEPAEETDSGARGAYYELLSSSVDRMLARFARGVENASRTPDKVTTYIARLDTNHGRVVRENLLPVLNTISKLHRTDMIPSDWVESFMECVRAVYLDGAQSNMTLDETGDELTRVATEMVRDLIYEEPSNA